MLGRGWRDSRPSAPVQSRGGGAVVTRLARALALALALPVASGHVCSVGTEIVLLLLLLVVVASAGAMARWCGVVWCLSSGRDLGGVQCFHRRGSAGGASAEHHVRSEELTDTAAAAHTPVPGRTHRSLVYIIQVNQSYTFVLSVTEAPWCV
jgi:hypothetical protein